MTFHTSEDVRALLKDFDILILREDEGIGGSFSGSKYWHIFHIVARKR